MPELVTEWGDFKLWPAQITAIRNLEKSLAANKPRALIQMATGSGKTFTAIGFIYRLIKFAGARRVLFLVDRGNLGRQAKKEFDAYVSPYNNYKFGEEYIVQHLQGNNLDTTARVTISTIQRMFSMLKGRELADEDDEHSTEEIESLFKQPEPIDYNPQYPIETFDIIVTDEAPPQHLQPVAPGARILRRPPDRPDRHAQQADLRLLQPEPGDGVRPRAGRGRRRERQLRRLPHQDRGDRGRRQGGGRLLARSARQGHPRQARLAARRRLRLRARRARPQRADARPDPHHRPHAARQAGQRDLFPGSTGAAQDPGLRQGRQPRREDRRDPARGVRPRQRVRAEDHLPHAPAPSPKT